MWAQHRHIIDPIVIEKILVSPLVVLTLVTTILYMLLIASINIIYQHVSSLKRARLSLYLAYHKLFLNQ